MAYRYDGAGNLVEADDGSFPVRYTYDAEGRLTQISYPAVRKALKYEYDAAGQLVEEDRPAGRVSYAYQADGNRVKRESAAGAVLYEHNPADQVMKAGEETLSYDRRGNLIERKSARGITRYSYDSENRLVKALLPDNTEITYGYGPLGDRIWRRDKSGTTYLLTDGRELLAELDEKLNPTATYVHAPGIDRPLAMMRDGASYFYHAKALGTVAALTDPSGKVAASYETDAFGALVSSAGTLPNRFLFTAREYDRETGLYYYRARHYDPALGRFLSEDPYPALIWEPVSLNPYAYVANAPTRESDPFGLQQGFRVPPAPPPPCMSPEEFAYGLNSNTSQQLGFKLGGPRNRVYTAFGVEPSTAVLPEPRIPIRLLDAPPPWETPPTAGVPSPGGGAPPAPEPAVASEPPPLTPSSAARTTRVLAPQPAEDPANLTARGPQMVPRGGRSPRVLTSSLRPPGWGTSLLQSAGRVARRGRDWGCGYPRPH